MKLIKKIQGLFSSRERKHELPRHDAQSKAAFAERLSSHGIFRYVEQGFEYNDGIVKNSIKWDCIKKLVVYKEEKKTYDEIRMIVEYDHGEIAVSEHTPGWYQFLDHLKKAYPHIPFDWDVKMYQPSFAASITILYENLQPATCK